MFRPYISGGTPLCPGIFHLAFTQRQHGNTHTKSDSTRKITPSMNSTEMIPSDSSPAIHQGNTGCQSAEGSETRAGGAAFCLSASFAFSSKHHDKLNFLKCIPPRNYVYNVSLNVVTITECTLTRADPLFSVHAWSKGTFTLKHGVSPPRRRWRETPRLLTS